VWASDCNDPVERQSIQRWTAQLLPPELIGSHVGPHRSHTTARRTDDSFRLPPRCSATPASSRT
jgi:alpha-galactosidase